MSEPLVLGAAQLNERPLEELDLWVPAETIENELREHHRELLESFNKIPGVASFTLRVEVRNDALFVCHFTLKVNVPASSVQVAASAVIRTLYEREVTFIDFPTLHQLYPPEEPLPVPPVQETPSAPTSWFAQLLSALLGR